MDELIDLWQDYDPNATGWISIKKLIFLLYELPPPLGKSYPKIEDILNNQNDMKISGNNRDKFLINFEKKIFIRRIEVL